MNSNTITIKDKNGHTIIIDLTEEAPVFEVVKTQERPMGTEKHHEANVTQLVTYVMRILT